MKVQQICTLPGAETPGTLRNPRSTTSAFGLTGMLLKIWFTESQRTLKQDFLRCCCASLRLCVCCAFSFGWPCGLQLCGV